MRWLLFALSLFALWFAYNALFMLPGSYSPITFGLAGIGIAAGGAMAWFSARQFTFAWGRDLRFSEIVKAPPMVLCIFILCLFCAIGVMKVLAYW